MKKKWFFMLAAVVIAGFSVAGCRRPTGVLMCEKTATEMGQKRNCQDEYDSKPKSEQQMMDKMGKAVMDQCGTLKGKDYEDCFNAPAMKAMIGEKTPGNMPGAGNMGGPDNMGKMHEPGNMGGMGNMGGKAPAEGKTQPSY